MYAIIEVGGKQYKVEKGSEILVDLIESKVGQKLKYNSVTLFRDDKEIHVGNPYVAKALVEAKVVEPLVKGEKQIIFKYKAKASYRRKTGHRQGYTKIEVTGVGFEKAAKAEKAAEEK